MRKTRNMLRESCRAAMVDLQRARTHNDRQDAREYRKEALIEALREYGVEFAMELARLYGGTEDIWTVTRILDRQVNLCAECESTQRLKVTLWN